MYFVGCNFSKFYIFPGLEIHIDYYSWGEEVLYSVSLPLLSVSTTFKLSIFILVLAYYMLLIIPHILLSNSADYSTFLTK